MASISPVSSPQEVLHDEVFLLIENPFLSPAELNQFKHTSEIELLKLEPAIANAQAAKCAKKFIEECSGQRNREKEFINLAGFFIEKINNNWCEKGELIFDYTMDLAMNPDIEEPRRVYFLDLVRRMRMLGNGRGGPFKKKQDA